ncbi:heparinase II/III domain-containing protein [Poseidonocella sedimentorum]|uniref:Uncharacterized conserved protein, heparinase superfamily n=1 Tax=Poseidonocella sedimentorum TaxID=871652 RepID=A0A1I6E9F2_9RHOB|nr:heparinase II/III family protein [Poseidonocella sedimentorum]SFR14191.1 Uncharacterized conserved protein, heparinase superfamily [Poseidonocella sedimentorum]
MSGSEGILEVYSGPGGWLRRWRDRLGGQGVSFAHPPALADPGRAEVGARLVAGWMPHPMTGAEVELPRAGPWALLPGDPALAPQAHGFGWLEDLSADGTQAARETAQRWVGHWLAAHGRARGAAWRPEISAARLRRMLGQATFLFAGLSADARQPLYRSMATHARALDRAWRRLPHGAARLPALAAVLSADAALDGLRINAPRARAALTRECARARSAAGPCFGQRDPSVLLSLLEALIEARRALAARGHDQPPALASAIAELAAALRHLRHADGSLARFGPPRALRPGQLDRALSEAGPARPKEGQTQLLGYARLAEGHSTVLIDAALTRPGASRGQRQEAPGALGIEFCGAGTRMLTAEPGDSGLSLGGAARGRAAHVPTKVTRTPEGQRFEGGYDGFAARTGLTHARTLTLSDGGTILRGEDLLIAVDAKAEARFMAFGSCDATLAFGLAPGLTPEPQDGGRAVLLDCGPADPWLFSVAHGLSVALETGRRPRLIIRAPITRPATVLRWVLRKV